MGVGGSLSCIRLVFSKCMLGPVQAMGRNLEVDVEDEKDSSLSEYIWKLKDSGITNYDIKWTILRKAPKYNKIKGLCSLCIAEKLEIANFRCFRPLLYFCLQKSQFLDYLFIMVAV